MSSGGVVEPIKVAGLRKSYGEIRAVDGAEFSVQPGQAFAFSGPNGAGKSTTINMLCTLSTPDAGKILVDGSPWWRIRRRSSAGTDVLKISRQTPNWPR
ncbi:MAG: ATP-binding cassette domain-containing protein [Propionibacteriaceae bacterium]|jgi:ABC-type multidrug transport system ATPase subunit|nr:ATP-binding cassette domain-containing protein [Propionibacteriaceae bacterium]